MTAARTLPEPAVQLYCAREEADLDRTFALLADLGCTRVEPYGQQLFDASLMPRLARYGLAAPTIHVSLLELATDASRVVDAAAKLGVQLVVIAIGKPADLELPHWRALGERIEALTEVAQTAGMQLAWHNHGFEFERDQQAQRPLETLLGAAPTLSWEIDIGWVVRAGECPQQWLRWFEGRISAVHLKDVARNEADDEDGWADLGHGVVDWDELLPTLAALQPQHVILEHDKPGSFERFVRRSLATYRHWTEGAS